MGERLLSAVRGGTGQSAESRPGRGAAGSADGPDPIPVPLPGLRAAGGAWAPPGAEEAGIRRFSAFSPFSGALSSSEDAGQRIAARTAAPAALRAVSQRGCRCFGAVWKPAPLRRLCTRRPVSRASHGWQGRARSSATRGSRDRRGK